MWNGYSVFLIVFFKSFFPLLFLRYLKSLFLRKYLDTYLLFSSSFFSYRVTCQYGPADAHLYINLYRLGIILLSRRLLTEVGEWQLEPQPYIHLAHRMRAFDDLYPSYCRPPTLRSNSKIVPSNILLWKRQVTNSIILLQDENALLLTYPTIPYLRLARTSASQHLV